MGKRKHCEDENGPAASAEPTSIGQLTSHLANKQKRSAAYSKLKHKKEVSRFSLMHNVRDVPYEWSLRFCRKPSAHKRKKRQAAIAKAEELGLQPPGQGSFKGGQHVRVGVCNLCNTHCTLADI